MEGGLRLVCKGGGMMVGVVSSEVDELVLGCLFKLKNLATVNFLIYLFRSTNRLNSSILVDGQKLRPLLRSFCSASFSK